jgi:NADH-quinone oxidoreductase subunit J
VEAIFYISAAVAVVATARVITCRNAIHALLYLLVSFFAAAVIFFTLGAPLAAALQVIVYAGAIVVLFIFVVMMLALGPQAAEAERRWMPPRIWIGPGILGLVLAAELAYFFSLGDLRDMETRIVGPKEVGSFLLIEYVIGVELASLLLLAGLVGAYHLGKRMQIQPEVEHGKHPPRARPRPRRHPLSAGADGRPGAP